MLISEMLGPNIVYLFGSSCIYLVQSAKASQCGLEARRLGSSSKNNKNHSFSNFCTLYCNIPKSVEMYSLCLRKADPYRIYSTSRGHRKEDICGDTRLNTEKLKNPIYVKV